MSDVITVSNLSVHYPGCDALSGVDLRVPAGTVYALLGENGAGKTTLIRALTGFIKPTHGACTVLGLDPVRDAVAIRRRVGYVSDAPALYDWMRVDEIGWFAAAFYEDGFLDRFRENIRLYEIPESRKIRDLSRGQRAKVALALALAPDPELLIMDEPTSGVDPLVRREFLESMLDRVATGRTVLLSSHHIAEIERAADEVAILHRGRFRIKGSLQALRDAVSEVLISLEDPLQALPDLDGSAEVLSANVEGRQHRWIVKGFTDSMRQEIAARPGVTAVQVRSATLDELFVACIRGHVNSGVKIESETVEPASVN